MRASLRRGLVPALLVLALVGVVAIASGGSVARGTNQTRTPPDVLFDTILTLAALALIPAAVLLVYGLMQRREVAEEYSRRRRRLSNSTLVLLLLLVPALVYFHGIPKLHPAGPDQAIVRGRPQPPGVTTPSAGPAPHEYEPHFAWLPALAVVLLVGIAGGAWYLASRRKPGREADLAATEALADLLDDTLDDLRAEPDPRRAVIAAYARLERTLAAHGISRRPSETPEELLHRALGGLDVSAGAIRRLTELFERARFSQHDVDVEMKEEAIAALEQVRDELRELAARRAPSAAEAARPLEEGA